MNEMVERFVTKARANPDCIAVQDHEITFSFADLLDLAQRFSAQFSDASEAPRILIRLPQCARAYAAEIGVLMAGGTFCPVDNQLPDTRLREIISLFDPHAMCSDATPGWSDPPPWIDASAVSAAPSQEAIRPAAEHAYVIFTSGSTGRPKGVVIRSSSLPPFFDWLNTTFRPTPGDRWAQFSGLGFDLSIVDLFGALTSGAALVPVTSPADRLLPGRFIRREKITIWHSVPSIIPAMVECDAIGDDALASLRIASFCGEPLYRYYLSSLFKKNSTMRVFNTYGPTEGTLFCSYQALTSDTYTEYCQGTAAIGAPIPGWKLVLTSADDVAEPDTFEVTVAGDHVGAGYIGGTPEDRARFADMHDGSHTLPAFRTGDLVRSVAGKLFFEGRQDRQVKVRGHRLELGEVEKGLTDLGAKEAHAFLYEGTLYAAVRGVTAESVTRWRDELRAKIPGHAVPTRIIVVDEFPRLSSGKIDYETLGPESMG